MASGTHSASEVTLFDAQNPNQLLEHFVLPGVHILSIACVPGQCEDGDRGGEGGRGLSQPIESCVMGGVAFLDGEKVGAVSVC